MCVVIGWAVAIVLMWAKSVQPVPDELIVPAIVLQSISQP